MPKSSVSLPPSETQLYFRVLIFSVITFDLFYGYTSWLKIPNVLNKSAADAAIFLMGLSMILSSVCYFWNVFDSLIRYRKHLGLVGYAYGVAHVLLSTPALTSLFKSETWTRGAMWPAFTGLLASIIFTVMFFISNRFMAQALGGKIWRFILRTGYVAIIFVWLHVVLLRWNRWQSWYQDGMTTWPSSSLVLSVFMVLVIMMRLGLWWSLRRRQLSSP